MTEKRRWVAGAGGDGFALNGTLWTRDAALGAVPGLRVRVEVS